MASGKASFCALAPKSTGGSFTNVSSSFGNLKPFFLKAIPKSLSSGKLLWQVVHDVWYLRENAGMAFALGVEPRIQVRHMTIVTVAVKPVCAARRRIIDAPPPLRLVSPVNEAILQRLYRAGL